MGYRCRINQHRPLKRWRKRMRGWGRVQASNGRIQLVKSQFIYGLPDLAAYAAHCPGLINNQQPVRFSQALHDGINIQWYDCSQVNHLSIDPFGSEETSSFERAGNELAGTYDRYVGAIASNSGRTEGHIMVAHRHFALRGE